MCITSFASGGEKVCVTANIADIVIARNELDKWKKQNQLHEGKGRCSYETVDL